MAVEDRAGADRVRALLRRAQPRAPRPRRHTRGSGQFPARRVVLPLLAPDGAGQPALGVAARDGFSVLEAVNYLEHYGLLRQRNAAGRYEKVDARHSWNSDRLTTNVFLFQLQRHSDHHANPLRRYQTLRSFDVSPQLPAGYATMLLLALVPPLWRRVMDHRVLAHYGGDASLANTAPPL
ncbi:fatty acid desaturase [Nucisporomicrobium flavum]|uniref:fatty acid desaturase n=1 Tax=Nucisporomicrobium flavum TaxID=2785915 RepID=UPI0027DE9AE1|nr:fatty acid desaturase [Nucisporomicrobium flavum]